MLRTSQPTFYVPTDIGSQLMWRRITVGLAIVQPTSAVDMVPTEAESNKRSRSSIVYECTITCTDGRNKEKLE